jgi:hypothetical protein
MNSEKLLSKEEKYIPLAERDSRNVKPSLISSGANLLYL